MHSQSIRNGICRAWLFLFCLLILSPNNAKSADEFRTWTTVFPKDSRPDGFDNNGSALGREMSFTDNDWIDTLAMNMSHNGETLRGLIHDIVKSKPFRSK